MTPAAAHPCFRVLSHASNRSSIPAIHDAIGRHTGQPGVRDRVVGEWQLGDAVRVAVERKDAARLHRDRGELVIEILTMPVAVDFDGDVERAAACEHPIPVRDRHLGRELYTRPCG